MDVFLKFKKRFSRPSFQYGSMEHGGNIHSHCQYALQSQHGNIHLEDVSNVLGEYRRAETLLNLVVPANPFVKA